MKYNTLIVSQKGDTLIIHLNRPEALNALNSELIDELDKAINFLIQESKCKGAIITGSGVKSFVAGADIKEVNQLAKNMGLEYSKKGHALFSKIENSPKPIVAAVNGFALGGGCELAMSCHFRTCSPNAKFGQPEVKLGLIAGYGGTQRLPRLVGLGRATELLIRGNMIKAEEAHSYGLVNHIFEQEELIQKTSELLDDIYTMSPSAVQLTLEAIYAGIYDPGTGLDEETKRFSATVDSEEGKEGTLAFIEKRKANFSNPK